MSRKVTKATRTSDVARPRGLAIVAGGAAVGAFLAVVTEGRLPLERVVASPHARAKVACASCHTDTNSDVAPAVACTTCHGNHASTRPAHRALAAKGVLGCPTCHAQHADAQGITFGADAVTRWGAGAAVTVSSGPSTIAAGTTVPLVPITACAGCHDPARSADPVAACVARSGVSQCFDEHARLGETRPASGVCKNQHFTNRFAAWDAARTIAATTPWVAPARDERRPWLPLAGALIGALVLGFGTRRRAPKKAVARPQPAERKRLPVIDPGTCLGCYACVDACPFDVLAIEAYTAVVVRPDECCGVVTCAEVCPNGSLRIEDGAPILDRPATDDLESRDVPGLFLAGDLTGLPLIKNAINQGVHAIDRIAERARARKGLDVVIVGAGPAGLSAALRAKERGLAYVVVEQATVAASIKSFPREKIVHDPPLDLPVEGALWLAQATKEELLAQWTRIVRAQALDVREHHRVIDLRGTAGAFEVVAESAAGPTTFAARHVILAIGRRGTPRTIDLRITPGCEDRVAYALADARSFAGKKVVVVGLGDTAMEAAIALAGQPGTTVVVVHRGAAFSRGKANNIAEITRLAGAKKLHLRLATSPVALSRTAVTLATAGRREDVPADAVLVLVGGVPSWELLGRAGIRRPV